MSEEEADDAPKVIELYRGEKRAYVGKCALAQEFHRRTEFQAQQFAPDLVGFVVILVDDRGRAAVTWKCREDGIIGARMLAGLATSAIQSELVAHTEIIDVLRENGMLAEPPPKPEK